MKFWQLVLCVVLIVVSVFAYDRITQTSPEDVRAKKVIGTESVIVDAKECCGGECQLETVAFMVSFRDPIDSGDAAGALARCDFLKSVESFEVVSPRRFVFKVVARSSIPMGDLEVAVKACCPLVRSVQPAFVYRGVSQ